MNTDEWVHYTVHNALKEERDRLIHVLEEIKNTTTEIGTLLKADRAVMDYAEKGGVMSDFQREHRYWAIKRKHLTADQDEHCRQFLGRLRHEGVPDVECVCVESDWPIYGETWDNVQRMAEGRLSIREERDQLREALSDVITDLAGGNKSCGHDFDCICAGDKARAALKATEE